MLALGLLGVPLLAWWLLGGAIVIGVANRRLPHRVDQDLVVVRASTSPPAAAAALTVELTPARARSLAREAARRAIPWGLLRPGMTVEARWSAPAPDAPLTLRAQLAAGAEPPLARAAVPARLVNALIERHHREEQAGSRVTWDYRLDPGSVLVDEGPPIAIADGWRRRFRATASGEVEAALGADRCLVRVSYVEAAIHLDLLRSGDGWRLRGDVAVGRCDSTIVECRSALLRMAAGGLPRLLETLLDQALSEAELADARLPGWFPIDVRVDGRLE